MEGALEDWCEHRPASRAGVCHGSGIGPQWVQTPRHGDPIAPHYYRAAA
eukprot:COSAG01_NODE_48732_length_378_cov_1.415771_2_plen_48_part_01